MSVIKRLEDSFLPDRVSTNRKRCDREISELPENDLLYLLKIKEKGLVVKNKPNSALAYCMGITDEFDPGKGVLRMSGELPDI